MYSVINLSFKSDVKDIIQREEDRYKFETYFRTVALHL